MTPKDEVIKITPTPQGPIAVGTTPIQKPPESTAPSEPQGNPVASKKMSMNDVLRTGADAVGGAVAKGAKTVGNTLSIGYNNLLDKIKNINTNSPKK